MERAEGERKLGEMKRKKDRISLASSKNRECKKLHTLLASQVMYGSD